MTTSTLTGTLEGYAPSTDGIDELVDAAGAIRDHWVGLLEGYDALGLDELRRRNDEIRLLLEQDGVTYNVATDTEHRRASQPWSLDPVPLVIPGDEWARIERGVVQRAELLDLVLRDLYGERRLLRSGVIPPEVVFADPDFLRPCDGIEIPGPKRLIVVGSDLVHSPDGEWLALGHRTQAPSGAAYALENRRVLSRVFPRLFRSAQVHRIAPFVRSLRSALQAASPAGVDDPTIVILSPGPYSETAFEHASIAALLGYPLVQGADLKVRDGSVWLRTVSQAVPVHVILRRVDSWFCDPLELRPDSTLGVPGLVDACRTGAVSVVNTLGSGVLENAALASLLPTLARHLLGEDLVVPSVPSWWCGDAAQRSHVLAHLGELVVRPLSRMSLSHAIDTSLATEAELAELMRRIEAQPGDWVGQERLQPATAPSLTQRGIEPRATVLRTFAVADTDSYVAMTGGMARTGGDDSRRPITNRLGAISKDTWVLSSEPESQAGFWLGDGDRPIPVSSDALPARAAENLFWLGRYAERAEGTVRLLRTVHARRDEFETAPVGPGPAALAVLLETLTRVTCTFPGFVGDHAEELLADPARELGSVLVDDDRAGSVAHAVARMFDAIDALRDQLSVDTWLVIGSLQRQLESLDRDGTDGDDEVTTVLNELLHRLLSLAGLASESMIRDQGWHFMDAGRRIERAMNITALVGAAVAQERSAATESLVLESVLTAGESIITYRRRYRSRAHISTALDLLFADGANPRSLRFQLDRLLDDLLAIQDGRTVLSSPSAHELATDVAGLLIRIDTVALAHPDERGRRGDLESFVSEVGWKLAQASNALAADFFWRQIPQQAMLTPVA